MAIIGFRVLFTFVSLTNAIVAMTRMGGLAAMGPLAVAMALEGPEANCSLQIELSIRLTVLS